MKHGKILSLALCLMMLGGVRMYADDIDLYLMGDDASYTSLQYANLRSLSFSQVREDLDGDGTKSYENYVSANYVDGTSVRYNLSAYTAFVFESTAVGIDPLTENKTAEPLVSFDGNQLRVARSGRLRICLPDGRLVENRLVEQGDYVALPALVKGTYIVNLGGRSVKILVK